MYFDGANNQNRSGIGVLIISPKATHIHSLVGLTFLQLIMSLNMKLAL